MASERDSEEETLENLEFDDASEDEIDEDILDALEGDLAAEEAASEEEENDTDDSDSGSDDSDSDDDDQPPRPPPPLPPPVETEVRATPPQPPSATGSAPQSASIPPPAGGFISPVRESPHIKTPTPPPRKRSLSPAGARRAQLLAGLKWPRSFTVEAIAAIPHPVPTHCLASSLCMTHLLTGSEDGYIRDYDVFTSVNGKNFLTAPQRHHCGVMEGQMKAVPIRYWWENPADLRGIQMPIEDPPLASPYSMVMHSDALWALAGTDQGHINLFTVRHAPGQLITQLVGHRGPVSALSLQHDERGLFSAGWDGEALHWDLNTGQVVRDFTAHGAQLAAIAVRPLVSEFTGVTWVGVPRPTVSILPPNNPVKQEEIQTTISTSNGNGLDKRDRDSDAESSASFDPLFDDEPEPSPDTPAAPSQQPTQVPQAPSQSITSVISQSQSQPQRPAPAPKNAPPILDPATYATFSPDILMTASIDGQVILWDRRVHSPGRGVGRLWMGEKTPPWCMSACWSADGSQIYAGRRNGTIDVWDVRMTGQMHIGTPRILKTLRNPVSSGVVSCIVAFPDAKHIACASNDNIRLWNVAEAGEPDMYGKMKSGVQFKIIPGHHGGFISQMLVDRAARFLISASSNRGWHGESTKTVFVHEIKNIW